MMKNSATILLSLLLLHLGALDAFVPVHHQNSNNKMTLALKAHDNDNNRATAATAISVATMSCFLTLSPIAPNIEQANAATPTYRVATPRTKSALYYTPAYNRGGVATEIEELAEAEGAASSLLLREGFQAFESIFMASACGMTAASLVAQVKDDSE